MRKPFLLFVTAAMIGGMLGLFIPDANAAMTLKLSFAPSSLVQGQTSMLTTGWHNYAGEPWGLDWGSVGSDVTGWIRGWAYQSDTSNPAIRTMLDAESGKWGLCENATRVDIYSKSTDDMIGTYWLVHTDKWDTATLKDLYHSSSESWFNWIAVDMIDFKDTCKWFGIHIHEAPDTTGSGTWRINTSQYPYAPNNDYSIYPCPPGTQDGSSCPRVNNSRTNWTRELTWSE